MSLPLIDETWLRDHPLPPIEDGCDKNARGRALVVGGAAFVPGALRLTGEAVLRAGAGKVQLATVASAAVALGLHMPEASVVALPADEDGEIALTAASVLEEPVGRCDALILGPGMTVAAQTPALVGRLLAAPREGLVTVLDAAALTCASDHAALLCSHAGRVIMTPHAGEMALVAGIDAKEVADDPGRVALDTARQFGSIVLLKGRESFLADPSGQLFRFTGGCVGLATAGSGDVLAGIIGGLAARGAAPLVAAAWGCWLHGRAGQILSRRVGHVGFLARELSPLVPSLLEPL